MKVKKLLKDEKGAILPLVAIILGLFALGFIALVVDAGTLYVQRKEMITSADAATLAGAQVLKVSKGVNVSEAKTTAENYAKANGADASQVSVYVGPKAVTLPSGGAETRQVVEVTVGKNQPLIFARFLGDENADVKAHAIATWGYVKKSDYFPLFIFDTGYKLNTHITLHDNVSLNGSKTNSFGFVQVGNNPSMSDIKQAIEGKISVDPKSVGDILYGVPGKRESVYGSAVKRIGDTVIIPIIDSVDFTDITKHPGNDDKNAKKWELTVKFFAYFEITSVTRQNVDENNSVQIEGQFTGKIVDKIPVVEAGDQSDLNPGGDPPATYIKLIK